MNSLRGQLAMSKRSWDNDEPVYLRHKSNQDEYNDNEDDDDDSCGFICFALGVIFLFVGVAILATVIVYSQSPEDSSAVRSLTSTRDVRYVSEMLTATIEKPYKIKAIDYCVNKTSEIPTPLSLLILVYSKPDGLAKRNAIRETWMKDAHDTLSKNKILVRFTVPGNGLSSAARKSLDSESAKYKDVVVLTDSNSSPESELLLFEWIWATQKYKYKYLMKTRDNMYIRIDQLNELVLQGVIRKDLNSYIGYFEGNKDPKTNDRLPEPDWFLCDHFIRYAHSGGYILSRKLVERLLSQANFLHPYNNEDVALGTWLSPFKDVDFEHNVYFDTEIGKPRGCNDKLIVFEPADTEEMFAVAKRLKVSGKCCDHEFFTTRPYNYNFFVLPSQCCTEL